MIKSKKQMFIVIGAFTLVLLLGTVSYAFFSYVRTGTANEVAVGRVAFNTTQTSGVEGYINLSNAFPVDVTNGIPNDANNVGEVTINVTGDTTYGGGVEYLVRAVNVTNTTGGQNGKAVPISISVTVENNNLTTLGTASNDYFTVRGSTTSYYKVLSENEISNNQDLVVGYIAPGVTGVNGNIVIKAYFDASKILISDTYPTEVTDTNNDGYLDGTPESAATGKEVYTTTEWNSLRTNGVSFQVNVVAQEGIWVDEPAQGTIDSCPNCKFIYTTDSSWTTTWNTNSQSPTVLTSGYSTNYNDIVTNSGKNYFLGVKLNNNNEVTNAYVCGVKDNVPFCIEGTVDGSKYADNQTLLQGANLWNNTCTVNGDLTSGRTLCGSYSGSLSAMADSYGVVTAGVGDYDNCGVAPSGIFGCIES